jgi:hypothetical protein
MKVALLVATLFITLLSACSPLSRRAVLEEELALLPSQDEFWQQFIHSRPE